MIGTEQIRELAGQEMGRGGLFIYDLDGMAGRAEYLQSAEMPYGLTVRYAFKANHHPGITDCFDRLGLSFDASSVGEAQRLLSYSGVEGDKISLSAKVLEDGLDLRGVLARGVRPVATALDHIDLLGKIGAEMGFSNIGLRPNPGEGSGMYNQTNVGGPASSFGIWKDYMPEAIERAARAGLTIDRIHTHIGSGVDPKMWRKVMRNSLSIVELFPEATTLDIGGGYKVARMPDEEPTDMDEVFEVFGEELASFADRTGRELHLEIEPGTWLVATDGVTVTEVKTVSRTSEYDQLTLGVGMNGLLRIPLYGAHHPIEILNDSDEWVKYAVFGPNCEAGDLLTPVKNKPGHIEPRELRKARKGDLALIRATGAYCMSMSPLQYNDVPIPQETVVGGPELLQAA